MEEVEVDPVGIEPPQACPACPGQLVPRCILRIGLADQENAVPDSARILSQAIGVLEQLHATGRRGGVISHIEDVKERIAVKIAVTPASNGSSAFEVQSE